MLSETRSSWESSADGKSDDMKKSWIDILFKGMEIFPLFKAAVWAEVNKEGLRMDLNTAIFPDDKITFSKAIVDAFMNRLNARNLIFMDGRIRNNTYFCNGRIEFNNI